MLQVREKVKIVDVLKEIKNCLGKVPAQSWANL